MSGALPHGWQSALYGAAIAEAFRPLISRWARAESRVVAEETIELLWGNQLAAKFKTLARLSLLLESKEDDSRRRDWMVGAALALVRAAVELAASGDDETAQLSRKRTDDQAAGLLEMITQGEEGIAARFAKLRSTAMSSLLGASPRQVEVLRKGLQQDSELFAQSLLPAMTALATRSSWPADGELPPGPRFKSLPDEGPPDGKYEDL